MRDTYKVDVALGANLGIEVRAENEDDAADNAIEKLEHSLNDLTDDIYIGLLEVGDIERRG